MDTILETSVYACQAMMEGRMEPDVNGYFHLALYAVGKDWREELLASVDEKAKEMREREKGRAVE